MTDEEKRIATAEKLAKLPRKSPRDRKEPSDLPRWARMALVEYETLDTTYAEVAKKYKRTGKTLEAYGYSPAGKKWRAQVRKFSDDPERISEAILKSSLMGVTVEYLMALEQASAEGDYKEVGVMSRDILDRFGVKKNRGDDGGRKPNIVINLGGGISLERPMVETSYEAPQEVESDYEIVDGDD